MSGWRVSPLDRFNKFYITVCEQVGVLGCLYQISDLEGASKCLYMCMYLSIVRRAFLSLLEASQSVLVGGWL